MAFTIVFAQPEEAERQRIWHGVWPAATPLDDALDFAFMARQLELTGGNIKNIAVAAAFLAATDGGAVSMRHLSTCARATKRELQKLGKTSVSNDFGPYADFDAREVLLPQ